MLLVLLVLLVLVLLVFLIFLRWFWWFLCWCCLCCCWWFFWCWCWWPGISAGERWLPPAVAALEHWPRFEWRSVGERTVTVALYRCTARPSLQLHCTTACTTGCSGALLRRCGLHHATVPWYSSEIPSTDLETRISSSSSPPHHHHLFILSFPPPHLTSLRPGSAPSSRSPWRRSLVARRHCRSWPGPTSRRCGI